MFEVFKFRFNFKYTFAILISMFVVLSFQWKLFLGACGLKQIQWDYMTLLYIFFYIIWVGMNLISIESGYFYKY